MSSGLGERSPKKVVKSKVKKASEDVEVCSGGCSGRIRCSERARSGILCQHTTES